MIVSGRCRAYLVNAGKQETLALMGAGDVFGEMPLFDGLGRSTAARAW